MDTSCASKLWLQYLDKVSISDWTTQMIELWKMTPYLSAVDSMTQPLNEIGICKRWIIWKKNIPIVQTLLMNFHCHQRFQLACYMIWWLSRWSLKTSGGFDLPVVLAYVRHSYWYKLVNKRKEYLVVGCVFSEILKISLNVGYPTKAWLFLHNLVAIIQAWHTASLNRLALKAPGSNPKITDFSSNSFTFIFDEATVIFQ